LDFEASWQDLSDKAIDWILNLLVVAPQLNVLRPATAIIRKLVRSGLQSGVKKNNKGKSKVGALERNGGADRLGFDEIWERMRGIPGGEDGRHEGVQGLFGVLVKRLEGTGDLELVSQR
jgi:engulfment/cell motility protein 1